MATLADLWGEQVDYAEEQALRSGRPAWVSILKCPGCNRVLIMSHLTEQRYAHLICNECQVEMVWL